MRVPEIGGGGAQIDAVEAFADQLRGPDIVTAIRRQPRCGGEQMPAQHRRVAVPDQLEAARESSVGGVEMLEVDLCPGEIDQYARLEHRLPQLARDGQRLLEFVRGLGVAIEDEEHVATIIV